MGKSGIVCLVASLVLGTDLIISGPPAQAAEPVFLTGAQVGTLGSTAINEASGMGASRVNSDVLWVHNDSGDSARVFAINTAGTLLGIYNISGANAVDWEDMSMGPGPTAGQQYLYLGDIGDNNAVRGTIQVYRVAEPSVSSSQSPVNINLGGAELFTLAYPDSSRDAETLMVDPVNGDLYVVSKRENNSRLYRATASSLVNGATITLEYKTQLPWGGATGGDISPDGDEILIRDYGNASLWTRPPGTNVWDVFSQSPVSVPLRTEPQGEAVGFDSDGWGYFTVSEETYQPIYYFDRVPEPPPLPGDVNGDGFVVGDDLTIILTNWGQSGMNREQGDLNGDLFVGGDDYSEVLSYWGTGIGLGTVLASVPEPATVGLLLLGGLAMLRRKRPT